LGDKKKKKKLNMDQELKEFRKQEKESKFTYIYFLSIHKDYRLRRVEIYFTSVYRRRSR
jgi:hypothetical protein